MMRSVSDTPKEKSQKQREHEAKDARLNKALRDNLRRRKAAARKTKAKG